MRDAVLLGTLVCVMYMPGQTTSPAEAVPDGRAVYTQNCLGCHGTEAEGSDRAPRLRNNRRVRTQSVDDLKSFIRTGRIAAGMPAFNLPPQQLEAVAEFVRSLNVAAADVPISGDASKGRELFFGTARCSACHMVKGQGTAVGPDLSNIGRELTLEDIRQALLAPGSRITPGYNVVTVTLRDGQRLEGFARGRSNFDLQLQDFKGNFYLLQQSQIASFVESNKPAMPVYQSGTESLQNLVAYLSRLTGVKPGSVPALSASQRSSAGDFDLILHPRRGEWPTYNGTLNANRFSELDQINLGNVRDLAMQWMFPVPHFGLEATPLVVGGVMYVSGPNQAYAIDAASGRKLWSYSRPQTQGLVGDASLGTNRGVALLADKIFMVTDNAHLLALNRTTGSLVWEVVMPEEPEHYGSTVAPLVVKDMVIAGVSGGDWGIRGFLAAYKAETGELLWRHWTIPGPGEPGFETWKGGDPKFGGGATWLTGSYDPEADTLYWPIGNPYPDSDDRKRQGDNLFTDCILALSPTDGKLKWYYQFTPHDVADRDANEPLVLIDTEYGGKPRKLVLHADRNGFFYVLDRTNGTLLLAKPFLNRIDWATGIGPDGRPHVSSASTPDGGMRGCPNDATNWSSTAYSAQTRLYYVLALEECGTEQANERLNVTRTVSEPGHKVLRAINIDTGAITWQIPLVGAVLAKTWPGVLATAGGLVFFADPNGAFIAADAAHGKIMWHFATNTNMKAAPITYMIDDKQFVAVAAGSMIISFGLKQAPSDSRSH